MKKITNFTILIILLIGINLYSQETELKRTSIRTGIGIAYNDGHWETGTGIIYSIGYQKSYGKNNRMRINPNLIFGGFRPFGITDTRDQYYRLTTLGINLHYDLIRYKSLSIVTSTGVFGNYSRGLLGTGGFPKSNNNDSEYFDRLYFGGNLSLGLRISPKNKNLAYEIRPFNVQFGNKEFLLGYIMFGIDFKLNK
tara:strand:+ start:3939 stop:4526 length:588 start_codon:yes stop_codon:yes gene_type:complete